MAKTSNSTWKAFERRVASFFRSVRTPLSGGNSKVTRSDTFHADLFVECKLRQKHAHHTLFAEVRALADKEGKIPVVVTQQKFGKTPLVILDMEDLPAFCRKFLQSRGYGVVKASSTNHPLGSDC